jgi:hypothetical protein
MIISAQRFLYEILPSTYPANVASRILGVEPKRGLGRRYPVITDERNFGNHLIFMRTRGTVFLPFWFTILNSKMRSNRQPSSNWEASVPEAFVVATTEYLQIVLRQFNPVLRTQHHRSFSSRQ